MHLLLFVSKFEFLNFILQLKKNICVFFFFNLEKTQQETETSKKKKLKNLLIDDAMIPWGIFF